MLKFIRLGKGHIHTAEYGRLALCGRMLLHDKADLPRSHVRDNAVPLLALAVAHRDGISVFQAQHARMRGILPRQDQKILTQLRARNKKTRHSALPSPPLRRWFLLFTGSTAHLHLQPLLDRAVQLESGKL